MTLRESVLEPRKGPDDMSPHLGARRRQLRVSSGRNGPFFNAVL